MALNKKMANSRIWAKDFVDSAKEIHENVPERSFHVPPSAFGFRAGRLAGGWDNAKVDGDIYVSHV